MFDRLWIYVLCPIWSFIVNCCYWAIRVGEFKETQFTKDKLMLRMNTVGNLRQELAKFKYKPDSWKDWTPWITTFLHRGRVDDCDGAAQFGKFLFASACIESEILHLRGKGCGHAVCVTINRKWMISNSSLIQLHPDWEDHVFSYHKNKYSKIV